MILLVAFAIVFLWFISINSSSNKDNNVRHFGLLLCFVRLQYKPRLGYKIIDDPVNIIINLTIILQSTDNIMVLW